MQYVLHIMIMMLIYFILAKSLNLVAGYTGLVSLAHAGFYGIGAYISAILAKELNPSFILILLCVITITGTFALIITTIALRTTEDYFIICTLGIQVIFFSVMNNYLKLTRGSFGISGIPSLKFLGISIDNKFTFFVFAVIVTSLILFLIFNIEKSPYGRLLKSINEDEIFTKSLGKNINKAKTNSFVISAIFAAIAGILFAHYISYIDPTSFTINESIFILSLAIIGGTKHFYGTLLATMIFISLPEILRFFGIPSSVSGNIREIIFGLVLILIIINKSNKSVFSLKTKMFNKLSMGNKNSGLT